MANTGWLVKCLECKYTRRLGEERITSECRAAKHMALRGHVVLRFYGDGLVQKHVPSNGAHRAPDKNGARF